MGKSDLVIDLMFLRSNLSELNNHAIHLEWHLTSNHASFTITIPIVEEFIPTSKFLIPKNSEEEEAFSREAALVFKSLDTLNLSNHESLELVINSLVARIEQAWNEDCNCSLNKYRESRNLEDWKLFRKTVKIIKRLFFDIKIQEVANKSCGLWELINWVNKCKLPAMEAIKYDNQLCLSLDSL